MLFQEIFQADPEVEVEAPGRVNLLGEHTDYNHGWVLPTPVKRRTVIQAKKSNYNKVTVYPEVFDEKRTFIVSSQTYGGWMDYVNGSLFELKRAGYEFGGMDLYISTDVPLGMGLSSSASLEVAVLRTAKELYELTVSDEEIAKIGQQAEWNFAGVKCGIMDQMACSLGRLHYALMLDTQTLVYENVKLIDGHTIEVIESGTSRALANSAYNKRREECEEACRSLKISSLREIEKSDLRILENLSATLEKRVRHVLTENERVKAGVKALKSSDAKEFGNLMNASHESLCRDYEVSTDAIDELIAITRRSGALGSKLTGAGFGGAIIALVRNEDREFFFNKVTKQSPKARFL